MPPTPPHETAAGREAARKKGAAMPAKPGGKPRYPTPNVAYLKKAIRAVGRARPNTPEEHAKVRRYLIRRARALGASHLIPSSWTSSGGKG